MCKMDALEMSYQATPGKSKTLVEPQQFSIWNFESVELLFRPLGMKGGPDA